MSHVVFPTKFRPTVPAIGELFSELTGSYIREEIGQKEGLKKEFRKNKEDSGP